MSILAAGAQAAASQPTALLNVAATLNLVAVACAVTVLARQRRTHRSPAGDWALAMFTDLGVIVLLGFFPVEDDGSLLRHGYTIVLVSVLLLVPYLLVRFAMSLGAVGRRGHQAALLLTALQLAFTVTAPAFPEPGEPRPARFTLFIIVVLTGWTVQSVISAIGLWSAGRGQPNVVRRRMQALSTGAVVLALTLVSGSGTAAPGTAVQVVTSLMGVTGIGLLVLAFVVPPWLAAAWRAPDLLRLGTAERGLMAATTPEDVAAAILPAVVQLFGAAGASFVDSEGRIVAGVGVDEGQLVQLRQALLEQPPEQVVVRAADGGLACRLSEGWIAIRPGAFAPLLGPSDLQQLDRVGSFVDLALQRCRLFEEQARSRRAIEANNAELQTLIYSVSHDLRNPIISVLGYLDVLAREHAGQLAGDGEHYLERISVNALYMQSLIQDLLELSRIGRSEPPPHAVALADLTESVAQELRLLHPDRVVTVSGSFPVVWMSELRARQLLTNLLDNAAKYGGEAAVIAVRAEKVAGNGALVTVTDDGRGIAEHLREKAFDVFERLDAAHSTLPGTGMGLPICKRIVETLGGTISLDGPPEGQPSGTTVRIALPTSSVLGWSEAQVKAKENAP